jgi:hypothetical protein
VGEDLEVDFWGKRFESGHMSRVVGLLGKWEQEIKVGNSKVKLQN